jgi:hypothetical protein
MHQFYCCVKMMEKSIAAADIALYLVEQMEEDCLLMVAAEEVPAMDCN